MDWLEPVHYGQGSPIASQLLPVVKEIVGFVGIVNPTQRQMYEQAAYVFEILSETKDRIVKFSKSLKLTL